MRMAVVSKVAATLRLSWDPATTRGVEAMYQGCGIWNDSHPPQMPIRATQSLQGVVKRGDENVCMVYGLAYGHRVDKG